MSVSIFVFLILLHRHRAYVIASFPFTFVLLYVIRIVYANLTIQCSESENAYDIATSSTLSPDISGLETRVYVDG